MQFFMLNVGLTLSFSPTGPMGHHARQKKEHLRVAECRLHQVGGREALQLDPAHAPVFTPIDWGGARMNVYGIELAAAMADWFCHANARGQ